MIIYYFGKRCKLSNYFICY